jgi:uncharacterized protein DUF3466
MSAAHPRTRFIPAVAALEGRQLLSAAQAAVAPAPVYSVAIINNNVPQLGQGAEEVNDSGKVGVNNLGQSFSATNNGQQWVTFIHEPNGTVRQLPQFWGEGGMDGTSINNLGQIAGYSVDNENGADPATWNHAFITAPDGGSVMDLGVPVGPDGKGIPGGFEGGIVVNDNGMVAGVYYNGNTGQPNLVVSNASKTGLTDLGNPFKTTGSNFDVYGFNNDGQICGSFSTDENQTVQAFLINSDGTGATILPSLPGSPYQEAFGVNDRGQVVGGANGVATITSNGVVQDLNTLVPPQFGQPDGTSGIHLLDAVGINDEGQIVVSAIQYIDNGFATVDYTLLLTPVSTYTPPTYASTFTDTDGPGIDPLPNGETAWTYSGLAGVTDNTWYTLQGQTLSTPTVGYVQSLPADGGVSSIAQAVTFNTAGKYVLSVQAMGTDPSLLAGTTEPVGIYVDGTQVGTINPTTSWATYQTSAFTVTAGSHTVSFVGLGTDGFGAQTYLANVSIRPGDRR